MRGMVRTFMFAINKPVNEPMEFVVLDGWTIVSIEVVPPFGQAPSYYAFHCIREEKRGNR